jgi:O-antigen ligase
VPDEQKSFLENEQNIYKERGWDPNSFIARQFKRKVMSGEVIGFSASPNTYAMMLVLLGIITVGMATQRISDRDEWGWATFILATIPPALLMLWLTQCRAALATPVIGLCLLAAAARWADRRTLPLSWLVAMHRRAYWVAVSAVLAGVFAIVAFGISRGSLVHDSLTFRWRYWIGSWRIFVGHWLSGVGFANFGGHYLAVRLPIASEEIKDPHNFFVRIAVETGSVGAVLLVAWMLRLWWEMSCPQTILESEERPSPRPLSSALAIAAGAMLINTLASVDFSQSIPYVSIEVLKRILWLGLLFTGIVIGIMRSSTRQVFDDRPAPWLLWAMLASLAVFLLHNTIEFGFFESGPLGMFALIAGAALGARGQTTRFGSTWSLAGIAIVLWLLMATLWVAPMLYAEGQAQAGDDDLQANRAAAAAQDYEAAFEGLPLRNADYAMKLAMARIYAQIQPSSILEALDWTVAADPTFVKGFLTRAQFRMQFPAPSAQRVKQDYQTAIQLNPNDVDVRTDYGDTLKKLGFAQEAADAYRAALQKNDGLSPDEPKRLTSDQVQALQKKIAWLDSK